MKSWNLFLSKLAAMLCIGALFVLSCGFTFEPASALEEGYVNFETPAENVNAAKTATAQYNITRTFQGKTGLAGATANDKNCWIDFDMEKFADVHRVQVSVEWYDSPYADNGMRVQWNGYGPQEGKWPVSGWMTGTKSGEWITTSVVIENVDFKKNLHATYAPKANIGIVPANGEVKKEDGSVDYYGACIRSVKIIPLEYNYKLEPIKEAPVASFKAGETADETNNCSVTAASGVTPKAFTITDGAGVTKTGKTFAGQYADKFGLVLDQEKFADARTVTVSITWYDAPNSTDPGMQMVLQAIKKDVSIGTASEFWQQQRGEWIKRTDRWKTSTFTFTNCDFQRTDLSPSPSNLVVVTTKKIIDMNTETTEDDYYGMLISEITVTAQPEYSFSGLNFTDAASGGNVLTALNAGGSFYTNLTVARSGGNEAADVTLIVGLYSADGKLERISYQTKRIAPDGSADFQTNFVNPDDVTGKYIKLMVWDSMNGLVPISNVLTAK